MATGFPSPADDFADITLDLNKYLVENPVSTFFMRVGSDLMTAAGIQRGDMLVVDRIAQVSDGSLVIASVGDELVVRRLKMRKEKMYLKTESKVHDELLTEDEDFAIWGVVRWIIHKVQNGSNYDFP
jgi:DNA polymerase V